MNLVVSKDKRTYSDFTYINSLQNIDWSQVEVLIYHSSIDNEVDSILEISQAGKFVSKIIYINKEINPLYYGLFTGLNADIYDEESYLVDDETLGFLVSEYKQTGMTVKSANSDVETIAKLLGSISNETPESLSKMLKNPMWLKSIESTIKNVETAIVRTDDANVNMVEMFNKTSEIIETLQQGQTRTTEEIEKLSKYLKEIEERTTNSRGGSIINFPTYTVSNTVPRVLHVRVFSHCKYLFSFLSAYQDYLRMSKQINTKFLVAVPKLPQFIKKYESLDFCRLAPDTINIRGIEQHNLFVTFEPKNQVMSKFFDMRADLYIVLDLMYGEPLIKGSKVVTINAISGLSDVKRWGLKNPDCIISGGGLSSNIVIPTLSGYGYTKIPGKGNVATNIQTKKSMYFEACGSTAYAKLDNKLGI